MHHHAFLLVQRLDTAVEISQLVHYSERPVPSGQELRTESLLGLWSEAHDKRVHAEVYSSMGTIVIRFGS